MARSTAPTQDATPEQIEEAQEEKSALDVLLGASEAKQTAVIKLKPRQGLEAGLPMTIRSLSDREFRNLSTQAEVPVNALNRRARRAGETADTEIDPGLFLRLVVSAGTQDPPFGDPKVTSKFGVLTADEVIQKLMLPGEIAEVAEEIMDISGFNGNNIEYVKN